MATPAAEMGVFYLTSIFVPVLLYFTCSLPLLMTKVSLLILPKSGKYPAEHGEGERKRVLAALE